jgi:hypothetical protein
MKGYFRGLLRIFKITDEMCSITTVTDVSHDVIPSKVQSAFTEREKRILDQRFQTVFSETLVFIEDRPTY